MFKLFFLLLLIFGSATATAQASYLVYSHERKEIVSHRSSTDSRSIASLTKLMTALLVAENTHDWDHKIKYQGGIWNTRYVSKRELIKSLLIRSDNQAADALAADWPGGRNQFIRDMNRRAQILNMTSTRFVDPSGLGRDNISTAEDLIKLTIATQHYNIIREISTSTKLTIETVSKKKVNQIELGNTNQRLLLEYDNIILSKTGWTSAAGRCLALVVEKSGQLFTIIILGEKSNISREERARQLIENYVTVVEPRKKNYEGWFHMFDF